MEHYGTVSDVNTGVASWKLTLTRLWYGCCARRRVTWLWLFSQQIFGKNGTLWHVERGAFFLDLWLGGWARRTSSHISCCLLLYLQGARWSLDDLWHGWHLSNLDQPVGVHSSTVQFQLASSFRTRRETSIAAYAPGLICLSWKKQQETLSLR